LLSAAARAVLAMLPVVAAAQASGDPECAALPATVARDGADWRAPARALRTAPAPAAEASVGVRERATLTLNSGPAVKLAIEPRREEARADGYAGFVAFRSSVSGAYRVSLDDRAWIEVIEAGSNRPAMVAQSDKRMRCFGVGKNLSFELERDTVYFVQISGASRPGVGLLVSPP